MKALNYCLVQKTLLWVVVSNEIYNGFAIKYSHPNIYIEYIFIGVLFVLLVWAIKEYIRGVKQGRMHYCLRIKEK